MKYGAWNIDEVKSLFLMIEKTKKAGGTITQAFNLFGAESGRKANSVRNYYYQELSELESNKKRLADVGVDLKNHMRNVQKTFSVDEENRLMENIDKLVRQGYSVRKACFELSGGDALGMLRLQNKFRSVRGKREMKDNVTYMTPRTGTLTDREINSLFLGLVRLVKRSATSEVSKSLIKESEAANAGLRKALVGLTNKEKEYEKLRGRFEVMRCENQKLLMELERLKCIRAEVLTKNMKKLKEFKFGGDMDGSVQNPN